MDIEDVQDVFTSEERAREERGAARGRGTGGWDPDRIARGLGWFSIGLGVAEVIAPRTIARIVGSNNHTGWTRLFGLREIAAGIGILSASRKSAWLWGRVAGDVLDLGALGGVLSSPENDRGKAVFGIASVAGVTALDYWCATELSRRDTGPARAEANLIVDRPPAECYRFWRNFENLPRFMSYLESVERTQHGISHWVACGPAGARIEWDAEVIEDQPDRRIAWRSVGNSDVSNTGAVDFERAPGGRGTIVRVQMDYGHSLQKLGPVAALFGRDPEQMIRKELRRFKQVMETGEVITTEGQPAARASGVTWLDNIAR